LPTYTDGTVDHIAEARGFVAGNRLYEAFMRCEGKTPGAFREKQPE
jgi:transcriptional regulator GlxA family with amidase domain